MLRPTYSFILGNKVVQDTASKVMLPVINKYTGEVATRVALANRQDIDEALRQGVEAEGAMKALKPFERRAVLEKLHAGLLERKEEIVRGIVVEAGKPVALANAEFSRGLDTIQEGATAAGDWSERGTYNSLQTRANGVGYRHILTRRFPLGLLSFVTPFNFPLNLVLHKVCPAVAAGCPFVLKPSDRTPVTSLVVGEILAPLLPPGSVSVLPSSLEDAPMFSQDERIKCLSFTGSPKIGWMLKSNAGKKRVALELGGNAAVVVDNDVDSSEEGLQRLAERIGFGAFAYGGQTCISVQRVIVHVDILPRLREKLVAVAQSFNAAMGDPSLTSTKLGPLISQDEACRVERWVGQSLTSSSSSSSPKVLVGGSRKDAFYEATIVENVERTSPLWKAEIFGPVCVLQSFHKFEDAIALVNDSDFGLQAGIYTRDINKAFYAYEKLDVGGVLINDIPSARTDAQPYGGIKDSGVGREGVVYAMEEFSELKSLILKDIGASL